MTYHNSNSSAHTALTLAKQGISKQTALAILLNEWELTPEIQLYYGVHTYFIHQWQGKYLRKEVKEGIITLNGITYAVVYRGCSPTVAFKAAQVKCSFRASSSIGNFVLVQPTDNAPYKIDRT